MKNIRRRFIVFNMLVISSILIFVALFVFLGQKSDLPPNRLVLTVLFSLVAVFIGSFFISKIALKPIKNAWQKQLDFTADASHELRTPLAVIQTNLELVLDSPEDTVESQMKWLQNIEAESHRMAKLVNDLLTLSRADTNQQNIEKHDFMLDEVIRDVLIHIGPVVAQKLLSFNLNLAENVNIYGDVNRIKQLVVILVDNAIKYTECGGIDITMTKTTKKVCFSVKDTGIGMEKTDEKKIFERFYRASAGRQRNQDGSGLGLAIAKWIVMEHRGNIIVKSEVDKGTCFTVSLPIK